MLPPKDRFWADPHVICREGRYYIFIEEFVFETRKGHISVIIMDKNGGYQEPVKVIEMPYHMSYPFIFESDGSLYMIPETFENRTIQLFRCTQFPYKWEWQMNLMEGIIAVDTTLARHNGKWWMFTNVAELPGVSAWDELFIFYSQELCSKEWIPHPQNPVISDVRRSRPAGNLFERNGRLYRPSQNSSGRYGYGFNMNEVLVLDENRYEERIVSRVKPNWSKDIVATHTFNHVGNLTVIDAQIRRWK